MSAPRLSSTEESHRSSIVEALDQRTLREDATLNRIAEAAATICDVPIAHVSLMEDEHQCVVGHIGMEIEDYDRDKTFCAYTIADAAVVIVEDANDDERFANNPFVMDDPGISFYIGLPIIVRDVPVGTLCAIDTKPRDFEHQRRSELFSLVNTVESHLSVLFQHGPESMEYVVSSRLAAGRALAVKERFRDTGDEQLSKTLRELEEQLESGFQALAEMDTDQELALGTASTFAEDDSDGQ